MIMEKLNIKLITKNKYSNICIFGIIYTHTTTNNNKNNNNKILKFLFILETK